MNIHSNNDTPALKEQALKEMIYRAEQTAAHLKVIANPLRLMVLCSLVKDSKNVSELVELTGVSQTLMSNHLAVLRKEGLVDCKRDHRTLNYYLKDQRMQALLITLYKVYCEQDNSEMSKAD